MVEESTKITPLMQQYLALKEQYSSYLLLYRLGDFYELFGEDAVLSSKLLNIVLTKRGDVPMCGIPAHSYESYLHKLINNGFKVAICDQLETPEEAKKRGFKAIVRRDVVRIVTPGTVIEDSFLEAKQSNYLACIAHVKGECAVAWLELSTGQFYYNATTHANLLNDLLRISPKELLISDKLLEDSNLYGPLTKNKVYITQHAESSFDYKRASKTLCDFYQTKTLEGIAKLSHAEVACCGTLLEYIRTTQKGAIPRLDIPKSAQKQNFMLIDTAASANLELFKTQNGETANSLISVIDHTKTAPGARLLRRILAFPLACASAINQKLNVVDFFVKNSKLCQEVRIIAAETPDTERLLSRIILGRGSPKDVSLLTKALNNTLSLSELILNVQEPEIQRLYTNLGEHGQILDLLNDALLSTNLQTIKEGGFINPEYNAQLSELLYAQQHSSDLLNRLRDSYRRLTKIPTLKINYNSVIGYYVEVSAIHTIDLSEFVHRQSLVNCVRYTTSELKELENKIVNARDASIALEEEIFQQLIAEICKYSEAIALASHAVAELDVATSFAHLAIENKYVKPLVDESTAFTIVNGRHPVVEKKGQFIANSVDFTSGQKVYLITGPNMAGKSTFLRQNAIIAIMAHLGSFVPAEYAYIGVIDKIFSRVGASDNIAAGYSTFMVEMIETATTLNQATDRSLVILDEVGRGTGVCDGLSIAWSTLEYLHDVNCCRAMFATHYYELSQLENKLSNLKCFYMAVEEWKDKVVFLYQIVAGSTDKSYGIHVARLAGLPQVVIDRAQVLKDRFETQMQNIEYSAKELQ